MQPVGDVSVIICTHSERRWSALLAAVDSVMKQTLVPREILVVVDHNPTLFERVRSALPNVAVLANESSRTGWAAARNVGLAMARARLVAFLDDDAVADADWLSHLTARCADERVLGAGGAVHPLWERECCSWLPEEFWWVLGCSYRGLPAGIAEIRNVFGGCACFDRRALQELGGFRESMGIAPYCEETELCIRARKRWPERVFVYEPRARVLHNVPASRANWRYFLMRCYREGLSKARVSLSVGPAQALRSERRYV